MGQRSNYAATKNVQTMSNREECALSMEQRENYAVAKVAQSMLNREECARGMVQRLRSNDATVMDALTKYNEEVFVLGMGPIAILLTILLHLLHHIDQLTMKRLQLFPIILLSQLLPTKRVVEILLA